MEGALGRTNVLMTWEKMKKTGCVMKIYDLGGGVKKKVCRSFWGGKKHSTMRW
jgi:hypothetical protein